MKLFDRHEATELRELFAAMDAADEARAASAMTQAARMLRQHDFSFRHIVEEVDARGLLLPAKVGAAIRLMDSTTLAESRSAFSGVRRLMRSCGLTFAGVMAALDRQPVREEDVEHLRFAYQLEADRSRELEAELRRLRASVAAAAIAPQNIDVPPPATPPTAAASPLRNVFVAAILILGLVITASVVSSFADMLRSANATATRSFIRAPAGPPPAALPPREETDRLAPPRPGWNCWRNRGTQGPCF